MKIIVSLLIFINFLWAHPHTFINYVVKIDNDKAQIAWLFDEISSTMILMEFDRDGNGVFDEQENVLIKSEYFNSLKMYHFYTKVYAKGKDFEFKPQNFKASIKNGRCRYQFDILVPQMITKIEIFDEERLVAFMTKNSEVITSKKYKMYEEFEDFGWVSVIEMKE